MSKDKEKKWTMEAIENEINELKPKSANEIIPSGMKQARFKKGRPQQYALIKTNLDLTENLIVELDDIATYIGSNRQAVIKHFILNGLSEYYKTKNLKNTKSA